MNKVLYFVGILIQELLKFLFSFKALLAVSNEKKRSDCCVTVCARYKLKPTNEVKADLAVILFPQITATLNTLTLVEYSNTLLKTQAGTQ